MEGAEKFVLEGAAASLAKTACVYFESNEAHYRRNGYAGSDLYAIFRSRGFTVFRFEEGMGFSEVGEGYSSGVNENLVAVREPSLLERRTGMPTGNPGA